MRSWCPTLLFVLAACSRPGQGRPGSDTADAPHTGGATDSGSPPMCSPPDDTGAQDDTGAPPAPCRVGMVAVRDEVGDVMVCIDAFEASIDDAEGALLGNLDQGSAWPDGSTTATPRSVIGASPVVLVSWYQAAALCLNADKYLCSTAEWVDGCDGLAGAGGQPFPWGAEADDTACVTLTDDGQQQWDQQRPTGSLETCRSPAGAYDMAGNVWEWVDPGAYPSTDKVGGSYYSGGGNYGCAATPVSDHPPEFIGTIGFRCCATPTL